MKKNIYLLYIIIPITIYVIIFLTTKNKDTKKNPVSQISEGFSRNKLTKDILNEINTTLGIKNINLQYCGENCNLQSNEKDLYACHLKPFTTEDEGWSVCNTDGKQFRSKDIIFDFGNSCPSHIDPSRQEVRNCSVDCVVSDWSDFSECSQPCGSGGGTQIRTKTIITPASGGGAACPPESELTETEVCNTNACIEPSTIINYTLSNNPSVVKSAELKTGTYTIEDVASRFLGTLTFKIISIILAPKSYIKLASAPENFIEYKNNSSTENLTIYAIEFPLNNFNYFIYNSRDIYNVRNIAISYNDNPYYNSTHPTIDFRQESKLNLNFQSTTINSNETIIKDYTSFIPTKKCIAYVNVFNFELFNSETGVLLTKTTEDLFYNYVDIFFQLIEGANVTENKYDYVNQYYGYGNNYYYEPLDLNYMVRTDYKNNRFKIKVVNKTNLPLIIKGVIGLVLVSTPPL